MVQVVAAIIEREGRILICRRTREQSHALKWEFPGGKVEPGESPEQALARELEEELGLRAGHRDGDHALRVQLPGEAAHPADFFPRDSSFRGNRPTCIFHEMRWEAPERLADFDFVEGDLRFIRELAGYTGFYAPSDQTGRTGTE